MSAREYLPGDDPGDVNGPLRPEGQNEPSDQAGVNVGPDAVNCKPTSAAQFCRWWIDNVGPLTITHLHPEDHAVKDRARKEKRELTDDERQELFMPYGNSRTFPHPREQGQAWLAHNAAGLNTYFQAATFPREREKPNTKPGKRKCASVACVWADIDPPAGCADLEAWRREQVAALENHPELPPPHIVINSGNGVQPIWLLDEPFPIDGEPERWQEFERTSRAVVALFDDGDNGTWNVDRLVRLPFTTNYPDARKREKGRVACQSGILAWNVDRPRVSIDDLPKLDRAPAKKRVRESATYPTLWRVFTSSIRALGFATAILLAGLIFDRETAPLPWLFYGAAFSVVLTLFRLCRCIWVLEQIIKIVSQEKREGA